MPKINLHKKRQVIALGGGGVGVPRDKDLVAWMLKQTGVERPRICYVPTASGDSVDDIRDFYSYMRLFDCDPSHLALFHPDADEFEGHAKELIDRQHIVYVEGGNTANMLAIWRIHGVDQALKEAYKKGVIMSGLSAGSLCWFEGGTTDSFGRKLRPIKDGLGLIHESNCPHYDGESQRRPLYLDLVAKGELKPGHAADDGVALHYVDEEFTESVTAREHGRSFEVKLDENGEVKETFIQPRVLPPPEYSRELRHPNPFGFGRR